MFERSDPLTQSLQRFWLCTLKFGDQVPEKIYMAHLKHFYKTQLFISFDYRNVSTINNNKINKHNKSSTKPKFTLLFPSEVCIRDQLFWDSAIQWWHRRKSWDREKDCSSPEQDWSMNCKDVFERRWLNKKIFVTFGRCKQLKMTSVTKK